MNTDDWKSRKLMVQSGQMLPARGTACMVLVYAGAIDSPEVGRRFDLVSDEIIIGRSSDADIQVDRDSVSRRHARLSRQDGTWTLSDLQSTNGSYVNDVPVREHRLRDGDQVKIGNALFRFLGGQATEAALQDTLFRVAVTDGLTQAHTRRYFVEALDRDLARARRFDRPLTLLCIDLDHCKQINDTHGALTGDFVIKELARRIQLRMDRAELLGRLEGTQFGLLLPEQTAEQAAVSAEELRAAVAKDTFNFEGDRLPGSVSIGIAAAAPEGEGPATTTDAAALIKAAQESMQRAKRQGRNRVAT